MLDRQESSIVVAAQSGNQNAFEQLVRRYQNLITSLAFSKTGDLQRSEDIAQQAFLIAWEKRADLDDPNRFGAWLRSITRNLTMNSNRKSKRADRSAQTLDHSLEPTASEGAPDTPMASAEQQELLWASLKNIPDDYREALVLFYREEKSVAQVAELMELSTDAVKQRLSRGRAMLKSEVEQFVEDLLGSSKPHASFVTVVMTSLPTASTTAVKAVSQSGTLLGAKTVLGKMGLLATGPLLGVLGGVVGGAAGVAGAWYGTKAAEKYATSEEEKRFLWQFFWLVLVEVLIFCMVTIAIGWFFSGTPLLGWLVVTGSIVYTALLVVQIIWFIRKQKSFHEIHGQPDYPHEVGDGQPMKTGAFKWSLVSSSVGCWTWLVVLSAIQLNWIVLALSLTVMSGILLWRLARSVAPQTLGDQLRFQASGLVANMMAAGMLLIVGEFCGLSYDPVPNWAIAAFVFLVGWMCAAGIWYAALKADEKAVVATDSK